MIIRIVFLLAITGLLTMTARCTSTESKGEGDAIQEGTESLGDLEAPTPGAASNEAPKAGSDTLPEDALGDLAHTPPPATPQVDSSASLSLPPTAAAPTMDSGSSGDSLSLPSAPPVSLGDQKAPDMPSDSLASSSPMGLPADPLPSAPSADSAPMSDSPAMGGTTEVVDRGSSKAGLQKIATAPWKQGKKWVNAVYFAHPGDTVAMISEKIFGADKSADLMKINPQYESRDLKPGDKVYYNSPQRPDDSEKLLTYYEDNNIQPQTYTAKSGDSIKKIAKNILGYDGAWKELWASNDLESKGAVDEGTIFRYWPYDGPAATEAAPLKKVAKHKAIKDDALVDGGPDSEAAPAGDAVPHKKHSKKGGKKSKELVAKNEPPMAPPEMAPPPPPPMVENPPPMAPPEMAPPPPPPIAENPQPPPAEMAPPPPPPPVAAQPPPPVSPPMAGNPQAAGDHKGEPGEAKAGVEGDAPVDNETIMAGLGGVILLAVAALFIVRRKRKQRELEQALNDTQVG